MPLPPPPLVASARAVGLRHRRRRGEVAALRGVTLDVRAGELVALTGPCGGGKSSLLRLLAGALRPTAGEVRVLGRDPAAALAGAPDVGLLDERDALPRRRTALEALTRVPGTDLARAAALLRRLGLTGLGARCPAELSGGERRRLAVALLVARGPALLLADEPTRGLDPEAARLTLGVLRDAARSGRAVLLATNDPALAAQADRTVVLARGRVVGEAHHPSPAALLRLAAPAC